MNNFVVLKLKFIVNKMECPYRSQNGVSLSFTKWSVPIVHKFEPPHRSPIVHKTSGLTKKEKTNIISKKEKKRKE